MAERGKLPFSFALVPFACLLLLLLLHRARTTTTALVTTRVRVVVDALPKHLRGFKVAHVSDVHADTLAPADMEELAKRVNALEADVVAITGDFVTRNHTQVDVLLPYIARFKSRLGTYASLGNHDHDSGAAQIARKLERAANVTVLRNRHVELWRPERNQTARVILAGIDNTGTGQANGDLAAATRSLPEHDPTALRILMSHDPWWWDTAEARRAPHFDLTLAGHTHGGQIGVELPRALVGHVLHLGPFAALLHRVSGLYAEDVRMRDNTARRRQLYVHRGVGYASGLPVRIGIPCEVALHTFVGGGQEL